MIIQFSAHGFYANIFRLNFTDHSFANVNHSTAHICALRTNVQSIYIDNIILNIETKTIIIISKTE